MLASPEVTHLPAQRPMNTLSSPAFKSAPALYPIATLKQVSESESAPALVPAYKFSCESGSNFTLRPVNPAPLPWNAVAVTIPSVALPFDSMVAPVPTFTLVNVVIPEALI